MRFLRTLSKRLIYLLLLVGLLMGGRFLWYRHQVEDRLAAAIATQDRDDPGWRLQDLEAARAKIADADNSALIVAEATKSFRSDWPQPDLYRGPDDDPFADLKPNELLTKEQLEIVTKELDRIPDAVKLARKLVDKPNGRHPIKYLANPVATSIEHVHKARQVNTLMQFDCWQRLQKGETHQAVESCRASLNASRSIGDEPLMISQLARLAAVRTSCVLIERLLAQGKFEDADLAELQRLLILEDQHPALRIITRGEKASQHEVFEAIENGVITDADIQGGRGRAWYQEILFFFIRPSLLDQHADMFKWMNRFRSIVEKPEPERLEPLETYQRDIRALPRPNLNSLIAPALVVVTKSKQAQSALLRSTLVAIAVERYRIAHEGRWPDSLEQLTPKLLETIPRDPYVSEPLRYRKVDHGVIVYSVGPDRVDNEGDLDITGKQPDTDIGIRLWNADQRRLPAAKPVKPVDPENDEGPPPAFLRRDKP